MDKYVIEYISRWLMKFVWLIGITGDWDGVSV